MVRCTTCNPVDLLAQTLQALIARTGIDPAEIEDIVTGCVTASREQGSNIGRLAGIEGAAAGGGAGAAVESLLRIGPAGDSFRFAGDSRRAIWKWRSGAAWNR
jgi:hypothetical protein